MGRYDSVELVGSARDEALAGCRACMDGWHIRMPDVTPLVLHFGIGEFAKIGLIEYWIANEVEAGYCGKFLFVRDGQTCPLHHHREKHETFYIVKGRVRMHFAGTDREMTEGDVLPVEPGAPHCFTGLGPALLLEVSRPCRIDDNYFADPAIPIGGKGQGRTAR